MSMPEPSARSACGPLPLMDNLRRRAPARRTDGAATRACDSSRPCSSSSDADTRAAPWVERREVVPYGVEVLASRGELVGGGPSRHGIAGLVVDRHELERVERRAHVVLQVLDAVGERRLGLHDPSDGKAEQSADDERRREHGHRSPPREPASR